MKRTFILVTVMIGQLFAYAQADTTSLSVSGKQSKSDWEGIASFSLEVGGGVTATRIIYENEGEREWSNPFLYDQGYIGSLAARKRIFGKHLYAAASVSYQQLQVYRNGSYPDFSTPDYTLIPVRVAHRFMCFNAMLGVGWSSKISNITVGMWWNKFGRYETFADVPSNDFWRLRADLFNPYSRGWHFALDRTIWRGIGLSAEANIGQTPFMTDTHRNVVGHPPSFTYQTHRNIHWFAIKVFWRQGFGKGRGDEKG